MPDFSLAALTYDPDGCLELSFAQPGEGIDDRARRVGRVQTLDGGVAVSDGGMVHGDRTFVLRARVSASQRDTLKHLYESYSQLRCATRDGLFLVANDDLKFTGNLATLRLLVIEKEG